ncbi:MAG: hypothetical protein WC662_00290 [Candidatus Paceibacterota bacterium]|jgi:hypothetical protein
MKILVNNEIVNFEKEDFPMLISGKALVGSGASFFSVSLMSKLLENGEKIVFFTAFPQAKELFRNQIGNTINENVIIIDSGDEKVLLDLIENIKDFSERIVLIKNIENYSKNLFNKLSEKKLIIFSGDIDKCVFGDDLVKKDFKTKIFFSFSEKFEITDKPELQKYMGLIISPKYNGLIRIDQS